MRLFASSAMLFGMLLFAGCDQSHDAPPAPAPTTAPAPISRPGVEMHAPNVDVKTNDSGTTVRAPGADVHVEKQPPSDKLPDNR